MKLAHAYLKSVSPYSQGKNVEVEKKSKELPKDYEERTWKHKCHTTDEGKIFIPPLAFANSIKEAAQYLSTKIPGKSNATYTKHFVAGIMVTEPLILNIHIDKIYCEKVFVPSDGKRGGTKRVWKNFPIIKEWEGTVTYFVLDDIITEDIFTTILKGSGQFIGIGRFRPINQGYYGRFNVEKVDWQDNYK